MVCWSKERVFMQGLVLCGSADPFLCEEIYVGIQTVLDDAMHTYQCLQSRAGSQNENESLEWWYMPGINKENMS